MTEPVEPYPRQTTARVWPDAGRWKYDVEHTGPPVSKLSGDSRDEAAALRSAAGELLRLARQATSRSWGES